LEPHLLSIEPKLVSFNENSKIEFPKEYEKINKLKKQYGTYENVQSLISLSSFAKKSKSIFNTPLHSSDEKSNISNDKYMKLALKIIQI